MFADAAPERFVTDFQCPILVQTDKIYRSGRDFFRTVRLPLLAGRGFDATDVRGSAPSTVVTATFAREMPNFKTVPTRKSWSGETVVYHCVPHGHCDQLRRPLRPELFVNTTSVHAVKSEALAAHVSQRGWLESSQGLDSMQQSLDESSIAVGLMSRKFKHAEGWWRHLHYGFAEKDSDPLPSVLAKFVLGKKMASARR